MTADTTTLAAAAAQAAYAAFGPSSGGDQDALMQPGRGNFAPAFSERFLGLNPGDHEPFSDGLVRVAHHPDGSDGFSATVFRRIGTNEPLLAVRGTGATDPADFLQDAELGVLGFARTQLISLYRYYRQLTTDGGELVQYSQAEITLLQNLNGLTNPFPWAARISNAVLNTQLSADRGVVRADGLPGSILQPGEELTVAGHSLGGHLALLFGRAFPFVTESIYTFNAPGILPWGDALLTQAGFIANDPSKVVNVVSAAGLSLTAAIGSKPGLTVDTFVEAGGPIDNHSIARLTDSLALHDLFVALSPSLAPLNLLGMFEAVSATPADSLEKALDMLGRLVDGDDSVTPIATTSADQPQREAYYSKLYRLRDTLAGGEDWQIVPLELLSPATIAQLARNDPTYVTALEELTPFRVGRGVAPEGHDYTQEWILARSEFLTYRIEAATADRVYAHSTSRANLLYIDIDKSEQLAVLNSTRATEARGLPPEDDLVSYLDGIVYDRLATFGSADPDDLRGSAGADSLFGTGGDDTLFGGAGDDVLDGGPGSDSLEGGSGEDIYSYAGDLELDVITDLDGRGQIVLDGIALTGGVLGGDGLYHDDDEEHTYELVGDSLFIDDRLEIAGFREGWLGIHLSRTPADGNSVGDFIGDRVPVPDTDPDAFGNPVLSATPQLGRPDGFFGNFGNNHFQTLAGPDYVVEHYGGNDTIQLGSGDDYAFAGRGDDYVEGGAAPDFLIAGRGNDTVYGEAQDVGIDVAVHGSSPQWPGEQIAGGEGSDKLSGSGRRDYIEGGAQADTILGGAGDDTLNSDSAVMSAYVTEAYDVPGGFSEVEGGIAGPDGLLNDAAISAISTIFNLPAYAPFIDPDEGGNDEVAAGPGHDQVFGGVGNDTLHGDAGNDALRGGRADDSIDGGSGHDTLLGEAGNDTLRGGAGLDRLDGGDGEDRLEDSPDADLFLLGLGDTAVFFAGADDVVAAVGSIGTRRVVLSDATPGEAMAVEHGLRFMQAIVPPQPWFIGLASGKKIAFEGSFESWTGLQIEFADGTVWDYSTLSANRTGLADYFGTWFQATAGADFFFSDSRSHSFAGGGGADVYYFEGGGFDVVSDTGLNGLILEGALLSDLSVFAAGRDYLVRYPGGDLLLNGDAAQEIFVQFNQSGVPVDQWLGSLAALAVPLPESGPQQAPEVQVAEAGDEFRFALPDGLFAPHAEAAASSIEVSGMNGEELPDWLQFDADERVLSGTPAAQDAGALGLFITLTGASGVIAAAPLVISVEAAAEEPDGPPVFAGLIKLLPAVLGVTRKIVDDVLDATSTAPMGFPGPMTTPTQALEEAEAAHAIAYLQQVQATSQASWEFGL